MLYSCLRSLKLVVFEPEGEMNQALPSPKQHKTVAELASF